MLLHHHFIRTAKKYRNKPAFVDCSSGKIIPYGKALAASLVFAGRFRGLEKGFVGIMIPTSAAAAMAFLGVLMSGRTPVMINYSTGAAENARYAQRKCGFRTIITSRTLIEKIGCSFVEGMVFIEDIVEGISIAEKLKGGLTARLPVSFILRAVHGGKEDDDLVVLFTSGSEKNPRAVELTHRNVSSNIESFSKVVGLSDRDRMFANLPLFHVFGLTINLWTALRHGMTIISHANPTDFGTIVARIREERPTVMAGTPSFLQGYLRKAGPGDFASLRLVVCGADKCPELLRQEFRDQHGITLYEGYGATETSPVISVNTPEDNKPGSVGKVLPGVEVRIEDYETGEDCPPGRTGRILVRGDMVMKGYYDDIEETSMRIRHGWYDTGDMGFIDEEGFLWHAGRLRRFVKVGGEMVSLVKVEGVLERLLPEDVSCCVVDVPDARKGSKIVAAVTRTVDERKLLHDLSQHLPNISLPRQVVVVEELPKMGSGKIDFRRVTEMVRERLS